MKWFLELGPCWGGAATVTPAADGGAISTSLKQEEVNRAPTTGRRRSKYKATRHWKPKLHAILEDNNINSRTIAMNNHVDVGKLCQHMSMPGIFKKQSEKIKHKIKAKVTKPSHKEEYYTRAIPHAVTVAPFSPTPFLL